MTSTITASIPFGVSVLVFCALVFLFHMERRRGNRLFAVSLREKIDALVNDAGAFLQRQWRHLVRYVLQLSWYYSLHSLLKNLLKLLVAVYTFFEQLFEKNRKRTRALRAEKKELHASNHLRQMSEHQEETALTATQKRRLRKRKLEERH